MSGVFGVGTRFAHKTVDSTFLESGSPTALAQRLRRTFDRIASFTIGAEEELLLVDPHSAEPAPLVELALELFEGDPRLRSELRASQVEIVTPICVSAAEAAYELTSVRRLACRRLSGRTLLVAAGAHPCARDVGPITEAPRYRRIAEEHPWAAQGMLTCGLHVHVAVGGADRALAVHNALRSYLPEIAALAANAPFYQGEDSGLATVRPKLQQFLPRFGVPPAFYSWHALAEFVFWAGNGGVIPDPSFLWWDLRLHPSLGTIEVRVADTQTRVEDTAAVIALVQSLAGFLAARHDAGEPLPVHPTERIAESAWLATRDGLSGWLADLDSGVQVATAERLYQLVEQLLPTATELGCDEELLGVGRMVVQGGGAARQRRMAADVGIDGLVSRLAAETVDIESALMTAGEAAGLIGSGLSEEGGWAA